MLPARAVAVVVDHGLRPESAAEARQVAGWLAALGLRPRVATVSWRDNAPPALGDAVQPAARARRLQLLKQTCVDVGAEVVLTGHHLDDQVETLVHRLSRGSDVTGLAGMRPVQVLHRPPLTMVRPLLSFSKAALVATCHHGDVPYVVDPSNAKEDYRRNVIRHELGVLAASGAIPPSAWYALVASLQDARARSDDLLAEHPPHLDSVWGYASLDLPALQLLPLTVQGRVVHAALGKVAPHMAVGRTASLHRLLPQLAKLAGQSVRGCVLWAKDGRLFVYPQPPPRTKAPTPLPFGTWVAWGLHRLQVVLSSSASTIIPMFLRPLRPGDLPQLGTAPFPDALPARRVLMATWPVVTDSSGAVVAIPHLGHQVAYPDVSFAIQPFSLFAHRV